MWASHKVCAQVPYPSLIWLWFLWSTTHRKLHPQEAPPTGNFSHRKFLLLITTSSAAKNTQFLKINYSSHTVFHYVTHGYVITLTILYMLCHMASHDFGVNVTWLSTALRFEVQGRIELNTHTVWYSITWPSVDVTWPSVDVTWPSYYTVFQDHWPHLCCTLHALKGRGITWTPRNRKPEKLRDTLRECEVWHARWWGISVFQE